MEDANLIAYLALALFIPASLVAFLLWRPALATAGVFLAAGLFLPEQVGLDMVGLPPFNKDTMPAYCVLLACLLFYRHRLLELRPLRAPEVLGFVLITLAFGTAITNGDTLTYERIHLPSLRAWDAISLATDDLLHIVLPFLFGTLFYRTLRDLQDLLRVMVILALIYSPLVILEVALSPQLHRWIYGFHDHALGTLLRFGGYRPRVFTGSMGLPLALFMCCAALAASGLSRARFAVLGLPSVLIGPWLAFILLICKSLSAISYYLVTLPVQLFFSQKAQLRFAVMLALLVASYPLLRITGWFPTEQTVAMASSISQDRAQSLEFRFDNEELLLEKALQRPLFGWGGYGRNRIYRYGRDVTTTDGFWIIQFGAHGALALAAALGLLLLPILVAARRLPRILHPDERILTSTLALIVTVYSIDLLPNGLFMSFPYLLAGALLAISRTLPQHQTSSSLDPARRSSSTSATRPSAVPGRSSE